MSTRVKYFNFLVLSAFLVGQVQYAYSYYFCSMSKQQVSSPSMNMDMMDAASENMCDQCQAVTPIRDGAHLTQTDCVSLITSQKSTVDNFTDSHRLVQHFISAALVGSSLSTVASRLPFTASHVLPTAVSPPLDLPTLNSNLRI